MQEKLNNIVLIGPMGSGKTTVGRRLAESLKIEFFDADHEIIDKTASALIIFLTLRGKRALEKENQVFCRSFVINLILFLQLEEGRLYLRKIGY